jgi:hypothetical protein
MLRTKLVCIKLVCIKLVCINLVDRLPRTQKVQKVLLLRRGKRLKHADDLACFGSRTAVRQNSRQQIVGSSIVREEGPLAETPQWRCSKFVWSGRALRNIVSEARSHVMHG